MEVNRDTLNRDMTIGEQEIKHLYNLVGCGNTDSIPQRKFFDPHIQQSLGNGERLAWIDLSFVRTAKNRRDIATNLYSFLLCQRNYRTEIGQALGDGGINIVAREAFAGGGKNGY